MKFLIQPKCGGHVEPNKEGKPITYESGDIVETERDLVKLYGNKFKRVSPEQESPIEGDVSSPDIPIITKVGKGDEEVTSPSEPLPPGDVVENEHGVDVSDSFPLAKEVDLTVFEKSKWYTVVDPDDGTVLNEKRLHGEKQVKAFLNEYKTPESHSDSKD